MEMMNEISHSTFRTNLVANREAWAIKAFAAIEDKIFPDKPRLKNLRIGFGMTTQGRRGKMWGEAWQKEASADGSVEITVRIDVADGTKLLAVLTHQKICTFIPIDAPNRLEKIKLEAAERDLKFSMKRPDPRKELLAKFQEILADIGPFPGAALDLEYRPASEAPKQSTRGRYARCPHCASPIRLSTMAAAIGLPLCDRHWLRLVLKDPKPGDPAAKPTPPRPEGWTIEPPDPDLPSDKDNILVVPGDQNVVPPHSTLVGQAAPVADNNPEGQHTPTDHQSSSFVAAEQQSSISIQDDRRSELEASPQQDAPICPNIADMVGWRADFPLGTFPAELVKKAMRSHGGAFIGSEGVWRGSCSRDSVSVIEEMVTNAGARFDLTAIVPSDSTRPKATE